MLIYWVLALLVQFAAIGAFFQAIYRWWKRETQKLNRIIREALDNDESE